MAGQPASPTPVQWLKDLGKEVAPIDEVTALLSPLATVRTENPENSNPI